MNLKKLNENLQKILEEQKYDNDKHNKRIFESNNTETYCINLYDAGEGKEMDFISRVEGFKSKEEAEEFAKKKYGNRTDIEYQIEKQITESNKIKSIQEDIKEDTQKIKQEIIKNIENLSVKSKDIDFEKIKEDLTYLKLIFRQIKHGFIK